MGKVQRWGWERGGEGAGKVRKRERIVLASCVWQLRRCYCRSGITGPGGWRECRREGRTARGRRQCGIKDGGGVGRDVHGLCEIKQYKTRQKISSALSRFKA